MQRIWVLELFTCSILRSWTLNLLTERGSYLTSVAQGHLIDLPHGGPKDFTTAAFVVDMGTATLLQKSHFIQPIIAAAREIWESLFIHSSVKGVSRKGDRVIWMGNGQIPKLRCKSVCERRISSYGSINAFLRSE